MRKTVNGTSTIFSYDESGHLLGEYEASGALIREYVWLGDIPVAVITGGPGTPPYVFWYVHADHLNTPRSVENPTTGELVWRWDSAPFGETAPDEDPDGDLSLFSLPLRFPGQYADSETGLHYNYFRDYEPAIGRYVQSDPMGQLAMGADSSLPRSPGLMFPLNLSYTYAEAAPGSAIDPLGLIRVKVYEVTRGAQFISLGAMFDEKCGREMFGCKSRYWERYKLVWTAEAGDYCEFDRTNFKVVNGRMQYRYLWISWWQATHTEYLYKSNGGCPCKLSDYRFESKFTPNPIMIDEGFNQ